MNIEEETYLEGWEIVIGLEVHCQIISKSKLFSGASAVYGGEPNTNVSFVDAAYPGVLPVVNKECIYQAIKTGLALDGRINKISYFDRKHYFYPDNPLGYQISQFYKPIMEDGRLIINLEDGTSKVVGIERLHIEQDAGKLLHDYHSSKTLVDLNRAGVGLMEIVSNPDMSSAQEASAYVSKLRSIVRYIGSCDGNMEEGSMRCDINISVREQGETLKRTRVEVKNVNSIRFIAQAINYEAKRQIEVWKSGKEVVQETRLFNSDEGITYSLRSKENATDYRYIRDPDLLPIEVSEKYIKKIKEELPELPHQKIERFINEYAISKYDAEVLVREKEIAYFFEEALKQNNGISTVSLLANWVTTNLFSALNKEDLTIKESKISPKQLGELIILIEKEVVSSKMAKQVFDIMWKNPNKMPEDIVSEYNMKQITDENVIEEMVDKVIANNKDKVVEIKAGKDKLLPWMVGQVLKISNGKANPEVVHNILKKKIYL